MGTTGVLGLGKQAGGPAGAGAASTSVSVFAILFLCGLLLRVGVFWALFPCNLDTPGHLAQADYIRARTDIVPPADEHENWQPPLYYVILAGIETVWGNLKFLQSFSLLCSIATLWFALKLSLESDLVGSKEAKLICAAIAAFLPQFVYYGLYISNDTLAIFLGFVFFFLLVEKRYFAALLAISLGLLTKGQFLILLALSPVLWRQVKGWRLKIVGGAMLAAGTWKYWQNFYCYHRFFLSNGDFGPNWGKYQGEVYRSFWEFVGIASAGDGEAPCVECGGVIFITAPAICFTAASGRSR